MESAVGREKDVQAIDLDSVMNQSLVQSFVILLRFPSLYKAGYFKVSPDKLPLEFY